MIGEVIRVGHPVSLNVRAVWILWVRPPVIALGEEIVRAPAAARAARSRDRYRRFGQILISGLQYAVTVECCYIEFLWLNEGQTRYRHNCQAKSQHHNLPILENRCCRLR